MMEIMHLKKGSLRYKTLIICLLKSLTMINISGCSSRLEYFSTSYSVLNLNFRIVEDEASLQVASTAKLSVMYDSFHSRP